MADHDVVFVMLAEALEAEPEAFRLSSETPDAETDWEQQEREIDEIRRLAAEIEEPEFSTYASS